MFHQGVRVERAPFFVAIAIIAAFFVWCLRYEVKMISSE